MDDNNGDADASSASAFRALNNNNNPRLMHPLVVLNNGNTFAEGNCDALSGNQNAMHNQHHDASETDMHHGAAPEKRKKKPYKELTLEEKVELIRLAERCTNLSQASIAERYAIAKSNVCRILQRREEYVRALESAGFAGSRKRKLRATLSSGTQAEAETREEEAGRGGGDAGESEMDHRKIGRESGNGED